MRGVDQEMSRFLNCVTCRSNSPIFKVINQHMSIFIVKEHILHYHEARAPELTYRHIDR